MVVPAGRFMMGSPASEPGRYNDEGPRHLVTIASSFAVGKYEVTRTEFGRFASASGRQMNDCFNLVGKQFSPDIARNWEKPGFPQLANEPALCVSWEDAQAYVRWLSEQSGKTYRLLSEAQWEYAARAGSDEARFWGSGTDRACQFANVYDATGKAKHNFRYENFVCDDGYAVTAPAGSLKPNAFGLYDMLGNVLEWVEDCRNDSYAGAPADGRVWATGDCSQRVYCGGSWHGTPRNVRSANRYGDKPAGRNVNLGFRVARTLE